MLAAAGLNQSRAATLLGLTPQGLSIKMKRATWTAAELVKIAALSGGKITITAADGTRLEIEEEER